MSHEAAQACIEKRKSDEAFRAGVMAVENVAGRLEFINAVGFECTVEEIESPSGALAEEELTGMVAAASPAAPAWMPGR